MSDEWGTCENPRHDSKPQEWHPRNDTCVDWRPGPDRAAPDRLAEIRDALSEVYCSITAVPVLVGSRSEHEVWTIPDSAIATLQRLLSAMPDPAAAPLEPQEGDEKCTYVHNGAVCGWPRSFHEGISRMEDDHGWTHSFVAEPLGDRPTITSASNIQPMTDPYAAGQVECDYCGHAHSQHRRWCVDGGCECESFVPPAPVTPHRDREEQG